MAEMSFIKKFVRSAFAIQFQPKLAAAYAKTEPYGGGCTDAFSTFTARQTNLELIVATVYELSVRTIFNIRNASSMAELDLIQADVFNVLALQGGEQYAKDVIQGVLKPRPLMPRIRANLN